MKLTVQRVWIFFLILLLSVGFGFAYDAIADHAERRNYPQPEIYAGMIEEQSDRYGVPEAIIWAVVKNESGFVSSKVSSNGKIGLMQISPEMLVSVYEEILHEPAPDVGMLYDPATNLRVGTARLSALYQRYGTWESVYAAWFAGTDATDQWLADPACLNGQGQLTKIPDRKTASFVSGMKKAAEKYATLYYETKSHA